MRKDLWVASCHCAAAADRIVQVPHCLWDLVMARHQTLFVVSTPQRCSILRTATRRATGSMPYLTLNEVPALSPRQYSARLADNAA